MLHVALDATAMPRRRAGAGVYSFHLTRALAAALPNDVALTIFFRHSALNDLATFPRVRLVPVRAGSRMSRIVWEQTALPHALRRAGVHVAHALHHSLPLLPGAARRVVTVHDVTFRLLPWRYTRTRRLYMALVTAHAARVADAVIVPSCSVARDLARLYGRRRGVWVIPEAPPPAMRPLEDAALLNDARRRLGLPERFIISVGTLEPGKNRGMLLEALRLLRARGLPHALVLVGQRGWGDERLAERAAALGLARALVQTGYLADGDLPLVYNLADACVYPSWREGFGLPPLEAMACGTPVVASDQPAMPEVLGDAALYASPTDPRALAAAVARVLTDQDLRRDLRARGLRQAAHYSWQRAAKETLAVYRAVGREWVG